MAYEVEARGLWQVLASHGSQKTTLAQKTKRVMRAGGGMGLARAGGGMGLAREVMLRAKGMCCYCRRLETGSQDLHPAAGTHSHL